MATSRRPPYFTTYLWTSLIYLLLLAAVIGVIWVGLAETRMTITGLTVLYWSAGLFLVQLFFRLAIRVLGGKVR
jgi:hypothetical protein